MNNQNQALNVGLFVTCLVDVMRPTIGFAALTLLEKAGCNVTVPDTQTCCGQPAFNSGDDQGAAKIAKQLIQQFEQYDYLVAPSGSCAAMIKVHFPEVLQDQPDWLQRSEQLSEKTYELLSFLVDVCDYEPKETQLDAKYTYHHSCSGLREMQVTTQPKHLLSSVKGLDYIELKNSTECCGFGGTFCVKYSDISNQIVGEKADNVAATGADILLGGDWGCLMNMAGKLNRDKVSGSDQKISAMHTAEVLAGMADDLMQK